MKHFTFALGFLALTACYGGEPTQEAAPATAAPANTDPGTTPPLTTSASFEKLKKTGLKLDQPFDKVMKAAEAADKKAGKSERVMAVMKSFTESLGVSCKDCHAAKVDAKGKAIMEGGKPAMDFQKKTETMSVAERMWNEWVVGFRFAEDGSPLFCDSCHQGTAKFLDRSEPDKLKTWMKTNFKAKLLIHGGVKVGEPVSCSMCHGKPFDGEFLDAWKAGE